MAGDGETALFLEYARTRDPKLREQLIVRYVGLVSYLARRFRCDEEQTDDLVQVGFVGLIKAIDRFDPTRGTSFTSYAVPTVVGEIRRYFRDVEQTVHLPRRLQELRARTAEAVEHLTQELDREPSNSELAAALDASMEDLAASTAEPPVSLEAASRSSASAEVTPLREAVGSEDRELERSEDRAVIAQVLSRLSPRERIILYLRFYVGLSQAEVARRLGISQMHVSRLQHRSLEKIKQGIEVS